MPNIASVLKSEIARLARREIRTELAAVKRASGGHRHALAALKRQVSALEKAAALLKRRVQAQPAVGPASAGISSRFQAGGFKSLRERLGLSAEKMGKLLGGVSALSVYAWEAGRAKPRTKNLAAIASLRSIGKREAEARLGGMAGNQKK